MSENVPLTMKDIARQLGVSVATVSRALQDNPSISKDRREMIQAFAREHNYYPNVIAEQLRHSKNSPIKVIGVIVPEFMHYYFASILTGIEEEASSRGYRIIVAQSREEYEREVKICKSFFQNKVCGIIVSQAKDTVKYNHFESLTENGVPLVFYDRICPAINANRVVVDDYMGTLKAVSYLIETGCKRVAFYGASLNMEIAKNRFNGYKDALQRNGIPYDDRYVKFCDNRHDAEVITPGMLMMEDRPDAFFAINDDTAIGILYATKRMGLKVPADVSICGFTNGEMAEACDPQLTTVEQRGVIVGKEAVSILIDKVEGRIPIEQVEKRVVKTRLVVRGTTR
ncbi:MAG: LacI family DNA-binding transcriptional regulator [Muribaculaceae bacterium]|nr:LacI family DNA-binding transcriptional regulator [Muribaculaceae bacterium]